MAAPVTAMKTVDDDHGDNIELSGDQLRRFIDQIERLEEEKSEISGNISDVYQGEKPRI